MTESEAIDAVDRHLRQGEPLLAYNAVQEGLALWPQSLRLRQLKGLATARSGDTEKANALLRELADEGHADAETLGILARTHKDLALRAAEADRRTSHLNAAFAIYRRAYDDARAAGAGTDVAYTGINAAAIAVLRNQLDDARQIAHEVRAACSRQVARSDDYWLAATLAEAALILGEPEAAEYYARAVHLAAGNHGNLASTRRQATLLARHLPGDFGWIAQVLGVPPLLMYTGCLIASRTGAVARFPPGLREHEIAAEIARRVLALRPLAAYGSAASAIDILVLETMHDCGGETHVVLPFPAEDFQRLGGAGRWLRRFERVLSNATSVTVTSDHRARGSTATFDYANLIVSGNARLRAQILDSCLSGLVIRSGAEGARSGDAALPRLWRTQGIDVEELVVPGYEAGSAEMTRDIEREETEHLPDGFSHEIRAMLFADAVGYSKLSEDQTPNFISRFWGAVADLNARVTQPPDHVETSGDGVYMVFADVRAAGLYALQLRELAVRTDWSLCGLPQGLGIRIALHAGPVYRGRNPLTGSVTYTGPHTSRAARIEPITPPGQVYASGAFAAVAAAQGVKDLSLSYVGRMPLAKNYGAAEIYHVESAQPPAPDLA